MVITNVFIAKTSLPTPQVSSKGLITKRKVRMSGKGKGAEEMRKGGRGRSGLGLEQNPTTIWLLGCWLSI